MFENRQDIVPVDTSYNRRDRIFLGLYMHSRAAVEREIVHSLNNRLTFLAGQHTMLNIAIRNEDSRGIAERAKGIEEAINNLRGYMEQLAEANQPRARTGKISLNDLIEEATGFFKESPQFGWCRIEKFLSVDIGTCELDGDAFIMLIISFLHASVSVYTAPHVIFTTSLDEETNEVILSAFSSEADPEASLPLEKKPAQKVGDKLGEIPLQTAKYVLESMMKNVSVELVEKEQVGFTCIIRPLSGESGS